MYADDTTFHVNEDNIDDLNYKLNAEARYIAEWCQDNKMVINTSKIKCMLITTTHKRRSLSDAGEGLYISLGNKIIEQVKHEQMLGVWVDDQLTWDEHINRLCKIIGSRLSLLEE